MAENANCETYGLLAVVPLFLIRQYPVKKLCHTKRNRTNGYLEQRQVKYTHCEPRTLAMFDATCFEFGTCLAAISARHHKNVPARAARAAVSGFNFFFHPIG